MKPNNVVDLLQLKDEVPFDAQCRNGRKSHDALPELEKLSNPVGLHETSLWNWKDIEDMDLEELPDPMPPTQTNNNFEDHMGYYDQLISGSTQPLSRVSTSTQINQACESVKQKFRVDIRKAHPDQNNNVDGGAQEINDSFKAIRNIYNLFKSEVSNVSVRLECDLKCDSLLKSWRSHVKHDDHGAKD